MKKILLSVLSVSSLMLTNGQMTKGDISPDWTMYDYLGNGPYTMSDYLDQGKTVYIDLSATWCGPCWDFHQTGALEELYNLHGPAGAPGVDAGTTDDVMTFFFESDASTTSADLIGTGGNTWGDWTAGVSFPIMDGQEPDDYAAAVMLSFYPTMIKICPDRSVEMFNPYNMSASTLYGKRTSCGGLSSSTNDAKFAINYTPRVDWCGTPKARVKLQNYGSNTLTNATINVYNSSTLLGTFAWTGNLAQYEAEVVTVELSSVTGDFKITLFEIAESDDDNTNNTLAVSAPTIKKAKISGENPTLKVKTDGYGSEFGYLLRDGEDMIGIYTGFFDLWGSGMISSMFKSGSTQYGSETSLGNNVEWEKEFTLSDGCHLFAFYDSYSDGMPGGYVRVVDHSGTTMWEKTSGAWSELFVVFEIDGSLVATDDVSLNNEVKLYPNPTNGNSSLEVNLVENTNVTVDVLNTLGQVVFTKTLTNVSGSQKVNIDSQNFESGLYLVNIKVGDNVTTKKLTVTK